MKELDSLRVLFISDSGSSVIGKIIKIGLCGAVIAPEHNSRKPEMGESGNIVMTAGDGKKKTVIMAWGQVGEHDDGLIELFFQSIDENSQAVLQQILDGQRSDGQVIAA